MSAENSNLALSVLGIMFGGGALIGMFTLPILMLCFPKSLKENALCPPHFTESHALTLNYFPYTFMRNTIIVGSLAIPFFGKRYKGLDITARKHSPLWFKVLAYTHFWLGIFPAAISLISFVVFL